MDTKSSRYQSRILREMRNNADNPFSPPSSTGSHGTVTLTSQLSVPDGESTRQPMLPVINTSVLGRTFPEWKGEGKENTQPSSPVMNNDVSNCSVGNASTASYNDTVVHHRDPAR